MFFFWRGGPKSLNFPEFFSNYVWGAGLIKFPIFQKFKKVQIARGKKEKIFLTPPPPDNLDFFFNLGKIWNLMTPAPEPNMGKI